MPATKKNTLLFVKSKLATDKVWATKAMIRIYQENQTAEEQVAKVTKEDNGIGFSGCDAEFLSSLAEQYLRRGNLSDKQMAFVHRKMPKYARQVVAMSDAARLENMVAAAQ